MEHIRARQSALMLTTERVGDPTEDASMKRARPALSAINGIGLVTIDSQMGVKHKEYWQRAYVSGFATRETAERLKAALSTVDSVLVLMYPHGESVPNKLEDYALAHMPRLPLTLSGSNMTACTQMPLGAAQTFAEMWANLLPELHAEMKHDMSPAEMKRLKKECELNSVQVFVVDTVWGRATWLFSTILRRMRHAP